MPEQNATRFQNTREFANDTGIVTRVVEESERRKKINHSIEATRPSRRQPAHVGAQIMQRRTGASTLRQSEQFLRIIDPVHLEARLGQQMRVAALTTGRIQKARPDRQTEQLDYAARFSAIALR